jgi:hypothetical protein
MKVFSNLNSMKPKTMSIAIFFLGFFLFQQDQGVRQKPDLPQDDRIRIAETFRLADTVQNQIWGDWSKAPFGLMLITNEDEYLIRHPHATNNFDTLGYDAGLRSLVLFRKRLFPTNLLATFPAINDISTVVVGQSANTGVTSSTAWVVTVLHEHFHQYQQSQPDYFASTRALGLSRGDETGMWMLNYPFPYDSAEVDIAYAAMSHSLLDAIRCQRRDQPKYLKFFFSTLERFKLLLSPDDFNYLSFQCWQEGVARYTELRVAELASTGFTPGNAFSSLKDYKPFKEVADSIHSRIFDGLANPSLSSSRRVAFYAFGAGEALLLDKVRSGWKRDYLRTKFHLEKCFSK